MRRSSGSPPRRVLALAVLGVLVAAMLPSVGATAVRATSPAGRAFTDPEGEYRLTISPAWKADHGSYVKGVEVWYLGPTGTGTFVPNVNILTQAIPATMTLERYLKLSIDGAPRLLEQFRNISSQIVRGKNARLAVWEFASRSKGLSFRHLGVFTVKSGTAVVATLTATAATYPALRRAVKPFLLTLD